MESRQMLERNQIGRLNESMKQNLDQLLLIEKLLNLQTSKTPFGFKSWWSTSTMEGEHTNTHYQSDVTKNSLLLKQQQQQQEQTTPKEYLDEIDRQLSTSKDRVKQLEKEIQQYKSKYSRLEQNYSRQSSIHLEKQLELGHKQDQLEKVITDLRMKHKQEVAIKERLENQLDDVLTQCDLKVKGYQQNIKEMQAIIDHNEELERFNSMSQLNNEKYHELEMEIERLQVENNDYRNRLNQLEDGKSDEITKSEDGEYSQDNSWSDDNDNDKESNDGEGYHFLDEQNQQYQTSNQNNIPVLASRSTSVSDLVARTEMDHTIALKNDELEILSTKNNELEVELKQAMETIDFLRRQHQDDRETIKNLSENIMNYLDQIKLLTEENKNLTFQQ